jgi:hypothetical protein
MLFHFFGETTTTDGYFYFFRKTFLLCLLRKGHALPILPSDLLRSIKNDFLSPCSWDISTVEGVGQALVGAFAYDEDEYEDEDGWSIPSDACTENYFAGRNDFDVGEEFDTDASGDD